jgi:hypothetical protein
MAMLHMHMLIYWNEQPATWSCYEIPLVASSAPTGLPALPTVKVLYEN